MESRFGGSFALRTDEFYMEPTLGFWLMGGMVMTSGYPASVALFLYLPISSSI